MCRILSLDGGGIRGTYTAAVLAEIEKRTGKRVVEHFDLIAGTSTGGIIALALAADESCENILRLYKERGRDIFRYFGVRGKLRRAYRAKHSKEDLQSVLADVLGIRTLGDLRYRVVVTAYNGDQNRLHRFRNYPPPRPTGHSRLPAVLAALATSAAPTYFGAAEIPKGFKDAGVYLDGGMCANSPLLVGIVEGTKYLHEKLDVLRVLSVGTLYEKFRIGELRKDGGIVQWNKGAVDLLLHGQQACAVTLAEELVKRMVRVTQETDEKFGMDDIKKIDKLEEWGRHQLDQKRKPDDEETHYERIKRMFFHEKAEPFERPTLS